MLFRSQENGQAGPQGLEIQLGILGAVGHAESPAEVDLREVQAEAVREAFAEFQDPGVGGEQAGGRALVTRGEDVQPGHPHTG